MRVLCCIFLFSLAVAEEDWWADEGACNPATRPRIVTVDRAVVWTPNFRVSDYPPNSHCEWIFEAPVGTDQGVRITFGDFDIQTCNNCECDYVEAWDGRGDQGPFLGRKCGGATTPYESYSRSLTLRFMSNDDGIEGAGFNVQSIHKLVAPQECRGTTQVNFTSPTGTITSVGYPITYIPNLNCKWYIRAPNAVAYRLIFSEPFGTDFCCSCDYLQLNAGDSTTSMRTARYYADDQPWHAGILSPDFFAWFVSDSSLEGVGFSFTWEALYDESELL